MPIIFWGSHHKTGTYAAQKTFSHLCKRMNWCCIFHVTRDSVHVIEETLKTEPVHILGHTQWIWLPEELGQKNYRFLHFYRKPYAKIVSGYRYHKDGAEAWCKKPLPYAKACRDWSTSNDRNTHLVRPHVARMEVQDYCQSVHLCEPCCRREHEFENVVVTHPHPATKNITKSKKHAAALTDGTELLVNVDDHPR